MKRTMWWGKVREEVCSPRPRWWLSGWLWVLLATGLIAVGILGSTSGGWSGTWPTVLHRVNGRFLEVGAEPPAGAERWVLTVRGSKNEVIARRVWVVTAAATVTAADGTPLPAPAPAEIDEGLRVWARSVRGAGVDPVLVEMASIGAGMRTRPHFWGGVRFGAMIAGLIVMTAGATLAHVQGSVRAYFRKVLRAWEKGLCPECGYASRGLPGPLCPECGTDGRERVELIEGVMRGPRGGYRREWRRGARGTSRPRGRGGKRDRAEG